MTNSSGTSGRSRYAKLLGVQTLATGSYVPEQVVTNADLQARLGFDPEWILQRSGIRERRFAPPEQATSDLAVEAGRRCLAKAGVPASDVDLVIVATFTPDLLCPSTACLVQHKLGITAPAMDVAAACAGFMYALVTGMQFVATGVCQRVLVIGADCNSRIVDPKDLKTYPLFGDGAGAFLLAPGSPQQGFASFTLGADGSGADLLIRGGGVRVDSPGAPAADPRYLTMDGKAVFKWAVRLVADTVRQALAPTQLLPGDVKLFIAHQANARIVNAVADELGFKPEQVVLNLDRYGNTSAGSIPLALDEALTAGRFGRGDHLVLSGFGAGLTWGTGVYVW
jgi:3-oxoacyl-[acyl-carrier-protein] synthase-3